MRYFKDSLNQLIQNQFADRILSRQQEADSQIPRDFLINHISGSFVEMVLWWIRGGRRETPEELDRYFRAVMEPALATVATVSASPNDENSGTTCAPV